MILNQQRNVSPRSSRRTVGMISAAALFAALLAIGFTPQIAVAQAAGQTVQLAGAAELDDVTPRHPSEPGPTGLEAPRIRGRRGQIAFAPAAPVAPASVPYLAGADLELEAEPAAPAKPRAPARGKDDASVERRLDRLERLLEELIAKEKGGYNQDPYGGGGAFVWGGPKDMARTQGEIERARREAARVTKEFNKNLPNVQRSWKFHSGSGVYFDSSKPLKAQRKMLEAQRKALEKQLEALDEQLAQLETEEAAVSPEGSEEKVGETEQSEEAEESAFEPKKAKR